MSNHQKNVQQYLVSFVSTPQFYTKTSLKFRIKRSSIRQFAKKSSVYNFRQIIVYQRPGHLFKGDAVMEMQETFCMFHASENK